MELGTRTPHVCPADAVCGAVGPGDPRPGHPAMGALHRTLQPGYKGRPGSTLQTPPPSSPTPAQLRANMCYTSCSPGCQASCFTSSPCQASGYVPVSCRPSVSVPVSCRPSVSVPVSCRPSVYVVPSSQSSVCLPVSCKPLVFVASSCQSSGSCQPSRPTLVCRPVSCSTPSCFCP
uniref:Keratin-associated protein 12-1-like n=3 Tax=Canis lupus familiaris TaxID=9615 RepID=A0A8C0PKU8_CANLF